MIVKRLATMFRISYGRTEMSMSPPLCVYPKLEHYGKRTLIVMTLPAICSYSNHLVQQSFCALKSPLRSAHSWLRSGAFPCRFPFGLFYDSFSCLFFFLFGKFFNSFCHTRWCSGSFPCPYCTLSRSFFLFSGKLLNGFGPGRCCLGPFTSSLPF